MRLAAHRISDDAFAALADGRGGSNAVDQLVAAEYSKHVLLIRGVVDAAREMRHEQSDQARQAYDLLISVQDRHPHVVDSVIRHPAVGAWARRTLGYLWYQAESLGSPAGLARVAAAAALRAGVEFAISVPVYDGALTLPALGRLPVPRQLRSARLLSSGRTIAVFADDSPIAVTIRGLRDMPGWQPVREVQLEHSKLSLALLIDDIDPYRTLSATPAHRLSSTEFFNWRRRLADAWLLLVQHHLPTAIELAHAIRVITPLRRPQSGILSVTSHETFGSVGMSFPSNSLSAAVTLTHELQHAKLTALLDQVALTRPDDGRRFYAPWRDDPRPVSGLLQGTYAYLGVAGFWRRQRFVEKGDQTVLAHAEFARWRRAARETGEALRTSGGLTNEGNVFVTHMLSTLGGWCAESVPATAARIAEADADTHLRRWRSRHPCNPG